MKIFNVGMVPCNLIIRAVTWDGHYSIVFHRQIDHAEIPTPGILKGNFTGDLLDVVRNGNLNSFTLVIRNPTGQINIITHDLEVNDPATPTEVTSSISRFRSVEAILSSHDVTSGEFKYLGGFSRRMKTTVEVVLVFRDGTSYYTFIDDVTDMSGKTALFYTMPTKPTSMPGLRANTSAQEEKFIAYQTFYGTLLLGLVTFDPKTLVVSTTGEEAEGATKSFITLPTEVNDTEKDHPRSGVYACGDDPVVLGPVISLSGTSIAWVTQVDGQYRLNISTVKDGKLRGSVMPLDRSITAIELIDTVAQGLFYIFGKETDAKTGEVRDLHLFAEGDSESKAVHGIASKVGVPVGFHPTQASMITHGTDDDPTYVLTLSGHHDLPYPPGDMNGCAMLPMEPFRYLFDKEVVYGKDKNLLLAGKA